jgi:hypothetical protein
MSATLNDLLESTDLVRTITRTKREHECAFCSDTINKGTTAYIYSSAKLDSTVFLHYDCDYQARGWLYEGDFES